MSATPNHPGVAMSRVIPDTRVLQLENGDRLTGPGTHVTIGGLQWLDYALSGPRQASTLVTQQKRRYLDPSTQAHHYYGPLLAGFRRAASSADRAAVLDRVVAKAWRGKDRKKPVAFRSAADGFLQLLPRKATGVPVTETAWQDGALSVILRHMIGLRLPDGSKMLVAPYCKEPSLSQDVAEILLHIMDTRMGDVLPGATPVVYDTRNSKRYKLHARTNRRQLEATVRAQASQYLRHWSLAA